MSEETSEVVEAEIVPAHGSAEATGLGIELPDEPEAAVQLLLEEVGRARDEASAYLDDLKRVAADFDNYRKRTVRDQTTIVDRAAERVVRELLPVLDTFDAAVGVEVSAAPELQLLTGMLNTRELLLRTLEKEGLEVIQTVGEPFDPEVHEPVGPATGNGKPVVGAELRRGYRLRGRVLRAALVALESAE